MIKEVALIGFGIALKDPNGRKVIINTTKNITKMAIKNVEDLTGFGISKTFKEITKNEKEVVENA